MSWEKRVPSLWAERLGVAGRVGEKQAGRAGPQGLADLALPCRAPAHQVALCRFQG